MLFFNKKTINLHIALRIGSPQPKSNELFRYSLGAREVQTLTSLSSLLWSLTTVDAVFIFAGSCSVTFAT